MTFFLQWNTKEDINPNVLAALLNYKENGLTNKQMKIINLMGEGVLKETKKLFYSHI